MKVLFVSITILLMIVGLGAMLVAREAEPTRGYVTNLIPEDVEQHAGDAIDSTVNALRSLRRGNDDSGDVRADQDDLPADDATDDDTIDDDAPELLAYEIADTGGTGVSLRSDCSDEARVEGGIAEGAEIVIVSTGSGRCQGWTLVEHVATATQSWVRDDYIASRATDQVDATTIAAAPRPPPSTATTKPTASASPAPSATSTPEATQTATVTASPRPDPTPAAPTPPSWFGVVSGVPGDTVSASIDGVECAISTAYERDGETFYFLAIPQQAPCSPSDGAEVRFTINGNSASATGVWQSGTATELPLP